MFSINLAATGFLACSRLSDSGGEQKMLERAREKQYWTGAPLSESLKQGRATGFYLHAYEGRNRKCAAKHTAYSIYYIT